ncbi:DUF4062 domain-containing protein [Algoriphagus resistens]|uniref:DUF4062 domain-containing protein n=1 Tax=Algoriphagus resistens TaxID=1750590 RepID=UPI0007168570|nr:DUF4062 domain-containing protein [Algoriphagus resistens]
MNKLNIFVSSTCYDLSQVRADMYEFIDNLGHTPMLSEFDTFPINPSMNAIDNCIISVRDFADVFILIIGSKYGYVLPSGKSITNTEFLTAKEKEIPIYIFIKKEIITFLPTWRKSKDQDYSNIVESSKIFELVEEIRDNEKFHCCEFEHIQDIRSRLKIQLSYLYKESLQLKLKLTPETEEIMNMGISTQAVRLILDKPTAYEFLFLFQTMSDEMKKKEYLFNDYEYSVLLNSKRYIEYLNSFVSWQKHKIDVLLKIAYGVQNILNVGAKKYFNEKGASADLKGLFYISMTYSRLFESLVNWSLEVSSTTVINKFNGIKDKLAKLASEFILKMMQYPNQEHVKFLDIQRRINEGENITSVNSKLEISINEDDLNEYFNEFEMFLELNNA